MPKKLQEAIKQGGQVDTQAIAAEVKQEYSPPIKGSYTTYADFEFRGKAYKAGDKFTPSDDVVEDKNATEFRRGASLKGNARNGIVFSYSEKGQDFQEVLPVA